MGALKVLRLHDWQPLAMQAAKPVRDLGALALRLWRASKRIGGTLAENFLLARGLSGPFSTKLRYNPHTVLGSGPGKQILPAMIAAVENDLGLLAVQRTYLDPSDILRKPLGRSKLTLGFLGTGAIRLAPQSKTRAYRRYRGPRSAMEWFGTPTWALGGVERLGSVNIPASVRRVMVYADGGKAAETLFAKLLHHLHGNGREVINRAPRHHDGWNDAWRAHIARPLRN
jgi:putative DNA primase/helicase